ncbi:MAG: putative metal-binding motif-containing protein, partial [Myxococcota bacterium]|nr:putative metal-binding motif-containing protein [Myxococcota bacterium]
MRSNAPIALALAVLLTAATSAGAVTLADPANFQEVNSWSGVSLDVPGYLGALMFSEDGDVLYVVGDSETTDHALYAVPVTRDPVTGQVTDLGPAEDVTVVFEGSVDVRGLDAGLEVGPEGTWFYTYFPDNQLGERPGGPGGAESIYDLATAGVPDSVAGLTFSPHVDDPATGYGLAQVSCWNSTELFNLPLTPLGGGLYEPGVAELFAMLPAGSTGAMQYVPFGPMAGDLVHADWGIGEVRILDIDPDSGLAIDADTGVPTLGTTNPVDSEFAADMDTGPWGLEFDPLTGDLFIATWNGDPEDTIIHITGDGFCTDADGDGWTDCEGDCDEGDAQINPGMTEDCNFIDDDCDGEVDEGFDADGDGVFVCDGDCDDGDPAQYPGAAEDCNFVDDDCDGEVDEDFDLDADGVTTCGGDCDDGDADQYPGADELCNGEDDDCDGDVDEDGAVDALTWYLDADGDGWGAVDTTVVACLPPADHVALNGDCNDTDPLAYPGAAEDCPGQDDDCDGEVDEGYDLDGDGFLLCGGDCDDLDA